MEPYRTCGDCKGTGKGHYDPVCRDCKGTGTREAPDIKALVMGALVSRGKRKGHLLRSPRSDWNDRQYYVWRLARFHTGADVTLPVMASVRLGRDPYRTEVDQTAEKMAEILTGRPSRGVARWHRAMYGS